MSAKWLLRARSCLPVVGLVAMIGCGIAVPVLARDVMLMNRIGPSKMELYLANADGSDEHRLLPASAALDYDPSFSPDGKWIVFTSERDPEGTGQADLWRVHPDGSELERLTSDAAMEDAGALSPDGTRLAFVSTQGGARTTNIWVMDLKTRRARNLTGNGQLDPAETMNGNFRPAWSPDGRWIACTSDRGERWGGAEMGAGAGHSHPTSLYIMRADGTGLRRLTSTTPEMAVGSPKWSPDGKKIVVYQIRTRDTFAARMEGFPGVKFATTSQIIEVDVASGSMKPLSTGAGLKTNPQYLANGTVGYLVKAATQDSPGAGITYSNGSRGPRGVLRSPSWPADGKSVVYYKRDLTNRAQYTRLYSWDRTREYRYTDVFPILCPKSGKLAITDLDFPFGNPTASISVLNPDGTGRVKVFQRQDGASLEPTWSPDCQWVAFGVGVYFGGRGFAPANLWMVKADSSESRQITHDRFNVGFPTWSPDGSTIIYRTWGDAASKETRGLRALKLADQSVTVLTTEWDNFPFYSPSGDRVVFTRRMPDADFEVFTMKPDGSDVKRLTTTRGADAHATWSTDGQEIWFESSRTGFKDEAALYDTSPQPYAQIFLMNRDGSHVRQLTDSKWEDSMGVYLTGRPDTTAQGAHR
jgi:Tol biopolymer transport system component